MTEIIKLMREIIKIQEANPTNFQNFTDWNNATAKLIELLKAQQ